MVTIEVDGTGYNTDSLVEYVMKQKKNDPDLREEDQYWAVFDRDSFPSKNFNRAFELAKQHDIRVAYSNECFEIWYLLHFSYFHSGVSRAHYGEKLSQHLPYPYRKNDERTYQLLRERQDLALRNAQRLLAEQGALGLSPLHANPSTTVHLLVQELRRYDSEVLRRRAEGIVQSLHQRDILLSVQEEQRIRACRNPDRLDKWCAIIGTVASAAELMD